MCVTYHELKFGLWAIIRELADGTACVSITSDKPFVEMPEPERRSWGPETKRRPEPKANEYNNPRRQQRPR